MVSLTAFLSFRLFLRISGELPVFLCWVSLNGRMTLSMKGTLAAVSWVVWGFVLSVRKSLAKYAMAMSVLILVINLNINILRWTSSSTPLSRESQLFDMSLSAPKNSLHLILPSKTIHAYHLCTGTWQNHWKLLDKQIRVMVTCIMIKAQILKPNWTFI